MMCPFKLVQKIFNAFTTTLAGRGSPGSAA